LIFGAVGGVLGATFNRSKILNVPFNSKKVFNRKLDAALTAMGYTEDPNANLEGIQVYRRSAIRQLFSGKIYVLVNDQQARISSRTSHIRELRRQLEQD
jgi:homoserine dehydrogenase